MSLNFLATRFQCTWPWSTAVLLCDGRIVCGCADPYGHRPLGDLRTSTLHEVWTGPTITTLRSDLNAGGVEVLRRLPPEASAGQGRAAGGAAGRRRRPAVAALYRVHGRLQHLVHGGLLRPGNRHHADASGRHARLRSLPPGRRRGRTVARTHRLLQLRRGVSAQARRGDVRVHQDALPADLSLHEHQRPRALRGPGEAAGAFRHRRGDVLDRRRVAGDLRPVPPARAVRPGDCEPARDGRREAPRGTRPAVPELALHPVHLERHRRRDGARAAARGRDRRRPLELGADRSSRERVLAPVRARIGRPRRRSSTRSGTTTASATRSPGRRPARASTCARWSRACRSSREPDSRCRSARACTTCRRGRFRRRPPTAAGSFASARSSATPPARSSTAISRGRGCRRHSGPATRWTCRSRFPRPISPDDTR